MCPKRGGRGKEVDGVPCLGRAHDASEPSPMRCWGEEKSLAVITTHGGGSKLIDLVHHS